jgi:hypothetical protein
MYFGKANPSILQKPVAPPAGLNTFPSLKILSPTILMAPAMPYFVILPKRVNLPLPPEK